MSAINGFAHDQIELPSGTVLKATLSVPPATSDVQEMGSKLAICLHPWGRLGGRMDDPVLHTLKDIMLEKGYHVLRYNSRGIGGSSGWPTFTGFQEAKDLQEIVQWALDKIPSVDTVVIAGYSYGSLIASLYPLLPEERHIKVSHILLSYPLGPRTWLTAFRGAHYTSTLEQLFQDPRANVLVVYGNRDDFTGVGSYDTWADGLRSVIQKGGKGNLEIVKVEGANHFWADNAPRDILVSAVREFL